MNSCISAANMVFADAPVQVSPRSVAGKRSLPGRTATEASDLPVPGELGTPALAGKPSEMSVSVPLTANWKRGNAKTDNISTNVRSTNKKKQPAHFVRAFGAAVKANASQEPENSGQSKGQSLTHSLAEQPKTVQLWLAQYSHNLEQSRNAVAAMAGPKAGYELARLLANLKANRPLPVAGKPVIPAGKQPQSNYRQGLIVPEPGIRNASKCLHAISAHSKDGTNEAAAEVSGKPLFATKASLGQQDGEQLMPEPIVAGSKAAAVDKRASMVHISSLPATKKTASPVGQDRNPEPSDAGDGIEKALGKRASVSPGAKTLESDANLPAAQTKFSEPFTRFTGTYPAEFAPAAERPAQKTDPTGRTPSVITGKHSKDSHPMVNSLSGGSRLQGFSVTNSQAKNQGNSTLGDGAGLNREPMLPHPNTEPPSTEVSSGASAQPTRAQNDASPPASPAGIREQLFESMRSSLDQDEQRLTIRLHPPELGKVAVKFQEQQSQITGVLEVSKPETRYEIERALPGLLKNLQEAGIQIKRLEVVLTDQPEQQPFKDQYLQNGSFQHGLFSGGSNPDNRSPEGWLKNGDDYQDIPEPQVLIADGSIDMLV
jgi:flagellar hook-length control protein FliK